MKVEKGRKKRGKVCSMKNAHFCVYKQMIEREMEREMQGEREREKERIQKENYKKMSFMRVSGARFCACLYFRFS